MTGLCVQSCGRIAGSRQIVFYRVGVAQTCALVAVRGAQEQMLKKHISRSSRKCNQAPMDWKYGLTHSVPCSAN